MTFANILLSAVPAIFTVISAVFFATSAVAQSGQVIEVTQPSLLVIDGERLALSVGDEVNVGDTILTGKGAKALVVFPDNTRIAVGPRSQLKIDKLLFRNETTARRFAVTAAKGTFRFLSGESPSRAYSVRTPIATMGVRGTVFDFAVPTTDNTDLVVYDGLVQFCRRGKATCARVPQGCHTVRMKRNALTQPATAAERREILDGSFPYASQQNLLRQDFHTSTRDCDGGSATPIAQIRLPNLDAPIRRQSEATAPEPGGGNPAE